MKRICWNRQDTGHVERFAPNERHRRAGESDDDFLARMAERLRPGEPFVIRDDDHPEVSDRTYRNAWTLNGNVIEHDMGKARLLHKAREAESGRAVRDQDLDAAKTVAELKAVRGV